MSRTADDDDDDDDKTKCYNAVVVGLLARSLSIWKDLPRVTSAQLFLVSLRLKANAELVPKTPICCCMFSCCPPDLNFL
jgi:hypothetical protein